MVSDFNLSDEDIAAAAQYWLSGAIWQERLEKAIDQRSPGELRAYHGELPDRLMEIMREPDVPLPRSESHREQAMAALHFAGYADQSDSTVLDRVAEAMVEIIQKRVHDRMQSVFGSKEDTGPQRSPVDRHQPTTSEIPSQAGPAGLTPLISAHTETWRAALEVGWKNNKAVSAHSAGQYAVAVRLFIEIIGDKRLDDITFEDAETFHNTILKLPQSHGKGRHVHPLLAIKNADTEGAARMSMKTVKRHNTAMNRYWGWLVDKKLIPRTPSPFQGHRFPGTKSSAKDRNDWTSEQLERLFSSFDYLGHPRNSARHWLPLISLHSGMRLEEICRLRPLEDVQAVNGIQCFIIQEHPDGWDPKTEAGSSTVPIHPWLIKHGILDLVEQRRSEGARRVFPELRLQQGKLGAQFSREFSRFKIALGFGPRNVFHSFRHTFRTDLENSECKDSHIDAVMGHEGEGGEGRTYKKRVPARMLHNVVKSFNSPLLLDFLNGDTPALARRKARRTVTRG